MLLPVRCRSRSWWLRLGPLLGLFALLWFLIRVVPKPSRAAYPCQRAAFPLASGFVLWLLSWGGAVAALGRSRALRRQARGWAAAACLVVGLALLGGGSLWLAPLARALGLELSWSPTAVWSPPDGPGAPMGTPRGVVPGRVVWAYDPAATLWSGTGDGDEDGTDDNFWWEDRNCPPERVQAMLDRAVCMAAGRPSVAEAWSELFAGLNRERYAVDRGYRAGDGIAVKLNLNQCRADQWIPEPRDDPGLLNGGLPSKNGVRALLQQLIDQAGVPAADITLYDASRWMPRYIVDLCQAEFSEVRLVEHVAYTRDGVALTEQVAIDQSYTVYYSDDSVDPEHETRLPQCVTGSRYLINYACLRGHVLAGMTLCAKNHFGSVHRDTEYFSGWDPRNLHQGVEIGQHTGADGYSDYSTLADHLGQEQLGAKTVLFLIDGLYATDNQEPQTVNRWGGPFKDDWTASLFVSQDPVALDSVVMDLGAQVPQIAAYMAEGPWDWYLHQAACADSNGYTHHDASGAPTTPYPSLGVHEHRDPITERYSGNTLPGSGIELRQARFNGRSVQVWVRDAAGAAVELAAGCTPSGGSRIDAHADRAHWFDELVGLVDHTIDFAAASPQGIN